MGTRYGGGYSTRHGWSAGASVSVSGGGRRRSRGRGRSSGGPSSYVVQPLTPERQAVMDAYIRRELKFWPAYWLSLKLQLAQLGQPKPPKVWRQG